MNERIDELAKQAEFYAAEQNDKFGVSYKKEYNQKFAELIIQKCIAQIALIGAINFENEDVSWTVETAIAEIEEHFGVQK